MAVNHRDAIAKLIHTTVFEYANHQEDELGLPVLKSDLLGGVTDAFSACVVAHAALDQQPFEMIDRILAQLPQVMRDDLERMLARHEDEDDFDDEEVS